MTPSNLEITFEFNHPSFLQNIPKKSGVYLMLDQKNQIIYVGKAKYLRNRLSNYYSLREIAQNNKDNYPKNIPIKTLFLVKQIISVKIVITPTENDAFILENNLIKQHKPRYNVRLVDGKSYPYLYISHHSYPRLSLYRGKRLSKGSLFGPYPSSLAIKEIINLIQIIFKIRPCTDVFFNNRSRPCLEYHIHRCSGPCTKEISQEDYSEDIANVIQFLKGKSSIIINLLTEKMKKASEQFLFEKAAKFRDQIEHIQKIQNENAIEGNIDSLDVFSVYLEVGIACVAVLNFRQGRLLNSQSFFPAIHQTENESEILSPFISQYYHQNRLPPSEIIVDHKLIDHKELSDYLSSLIHKKVSILSNVRAQKHKFKMLAHSNAMLSVKTKISLKSTIKERFRDLEVILSNALKIKSFDCKKMECFDISHTFGDFTVASNVVITPEGFDKSQYRRFNIEDVTRGDDFAAMRQAIKRRFNLENQKDNAKKIFPSILLIDGGKVHMQAVKEVLENLNIEWKDMLLMAISKGENRKVGLESIWVDSIEEPLEISSNAPSFHLLVQLRDEAHRFAIEGHRRKRDQLKRVNASKIKKIGK